MTKKQKQKLAATLALSILSISSAWSANAPAGSANTHEAVQAKASKVAALFGSPAAIGNTTRTVTLAPGMNYVNVASGESVAFRAGDKTVGWTFLEAVGGTSVDMKTIFPEMAEAKGIRVYIAPSRMFSGG
ncbi:CzcE family metal-binding protein [Cupriavidus basilensis]|uniref:CzcE family metal-binding protein n=1 Tax=Cupriavidus basilensis TaxID=68895 RepID=A0ABT6AMY6_9BURK|nr:CzcE family metal-binding protein [Cupriavidus basilensis]MDF3833956.1 CzcE family metal-binding protein [Cupriavidus basilensis]